MLTCPRATHGTHHAPTQPVRPVQHLLLPWASGQVPHGSASNISRESERSLAPPRLRADEVSLETLPCTDSLSQCSPSARPLDPAGRARGADSYAAARLARKRLRDEGSNTAKSSKDLAPRSAFRQHPGGDKVTFSKGATSLESTSKHTGSPRKRQDGSFCLQQVSLLDKPQVRWRPPGIAHPGQKPDPSWTLPAMRWPEKSEWKEMGSMGWGRDERNVIRAGAASGVKSCGFIKHNIIPLPRNIKGVKQKPCGR